MNKPKQIEMILAMTDIGHLGHDNKLVVKCSEDMQMFKNRTLNTCIIMGNDTFKSFNGRMLPDRYHIVLTRDESLYGQANDKLFYASSITEANAHFQLLDDYEKAFVIGGRSIYELAMLNLEIYNIHATIYYGLDFDFEVDTIYTEFDYYSFSFEEANEVEVLNCKVLQSDGSYIEQAVHCIIGQKLKLEGFYA